MIISKKVYLLPILALFISSCLTGSKQEQVLDQLVMTLEFTNINNRIIVQQDTVEIDTLRFLYGKTTVQDGSNDTLVINNNTIQVTHRSAIDDEIKGLANGSFNSDNIYNNLAFEIKQAEQSDAGSGSNFDVDAFIEGDSNDLRYSMILSGTYNGNYFEFKSNRNFNFEFPISDQTDGNQSSLLYNLPLKTNVSLWFNNESGDGLLNPGDTANATAINDNIQSSMTFN